MQIISWSVVMQRGLLHGEQVDCWKITMKRFQTGYNITWDPILGVTKVDSNGNVYKLQWMKPNVFQIATIFVQPHKRDYVPGNNLPFLLHRTL